MAVKTPNIFEDFSIEVSIPAQAGFTHAQRQAIKASADKSPRSVQQHCAVAEATNEAFGAVYNSTHSRVDQVHPLVFDGVGKFELNRSARARFGVSSTGHIFLTVGLVDPETQERYRLTWNDQTIPQELAEIAAAHDEGRAHGAVTAELDLGSARFRKLGVPKPNPRENDDEARERKNAARKGGHHVTGPRKHRRVCVSDIARIYA